jgi:hypothetical protein
MYTKHCGQNFSGHLPQIYMNCSDAWKNAGVVIHTFTDAQQCHQVMNTMLAGT